ncbi:MAG TPA: serine/threonine-protein kinase, partial [Polyangium sp.]|nr:serine/threonine-protein kinase [Polyangium sp.]
MTLRAGRYELLDTIASGGMATVHLGRAVGAGGFERLVAIKTMHPHLSSEPDFVAMFLDEARLAARIRHPNVVGTIDIQQDELGLLLVMEYVEGPSMAQIIRAQAKQKTTVPIEITLRLMLDMLAGLHAAHELCNSSGEPLNVVHRDVSPQNVLVGVDGIARIMDFGVARAESRIASTRSGDAKGKLVYMAPEQAAQKELDRRADVYAAGLVFWELLVGRRLLRGDNDLVVMHQIFHAVHPSPHEAIPAIPREISDVVMQAIAREPADRFPTTAAFADAIDRAARATNTPIASTKGVAEFVRALNLHKSPNEVISASRSLPAPSSIRTMPSAATDGISAPNSVLPKIEISTGPTSTESRGGFATTPAATSPPKASGRKAILLVSIGGALLFGAILWFA